MGRAARYARPSSFAQREKLVLHAARGAEFRGREPSVGDNDGRARHRSFILQLPSKLEETYIGNRTREIPIPEHASHVQIFDNDGSVARETRRELVQHIGPNVGDPPVQSCELGFRLGAIA